MKKVLVLFLFVSLVSCIVTTEKYRYQHRIDNFYSVLNEEEWADFKRGDFSSAAKSLSKRLKDDKTLYEKWKKVQYDEAIATFDVEQSLKFFYEIIFKELNRETYYKFMKMLPNEIKMSFINRNYEDIENYYHNDIKFKKFVDNLKKEYRFYKFDNPEIYRFFREIVFKEATQKRFYDFCKILSSMNLLYKFEKGEDLTLNIDKTREYDIEKLYNNTGLWGLPFSEVVKVYYKVVMKEMDKGAVIQTLHKF